MSGVFSFLLRAVVALALAFAGLHMTAHASARGLAAEAHDAHQAQHSHVDPHRTSHEHRHADTGTQHDGTDCGGTCCDVVCCAAALAAAAALPESADGAFADLALTSQATFSPAPDPHPPRLHSGATATV